MNDNALTSHLGHLRMQGRAETTIRSRSGALSRVSAYLMMPLTEVTFDDLMAWRASLSRLAPATIVAEVGHVKRFFDWLEDTGCRQDNPAARIPVPPLPEYAPHPIAEADLLAALGQAPGRIRIWLVLAAWCGLRAKEVAFLRRRCIREAADPPHIFIASDATKGHREGVVPLCDFAAAEIGRAGLPATGWAFPHRSGTGHVSAHTVSNLANAYLHGLGIPDTFHSLRHRFATQALLGCGDVRTVQELLRHKRLETTSVYTQITSAETAAAVAAIPAPIARAPRARAS